MEKMKTKRNKGTDFIKYIEKCNKESENKHKTKSCGFAISLEWGEEK